MEAAIYFICHYIHSRGVDVGSDPDSNHFIPFNDSTEHRTIRLISLSFWPALQ